MNDDSSKVKPVSIGYIQKNVVFLAEGWSFIVLAAWFSTYCFFYVLNVATSS